MWPPRRPPKTTDEIEQSVAYEKMSKNNKLDNLILVYEEAEMLLFEKPKKKPYIRKL